MPFIPAIVAGVGSIVGGALGSRAAGKAADAQSQAAMYAADLQRQTSKESLDFQKQMYADQLARMAPFLQAGTGAVGELASLMQKGGALYDIPQFQAPTATNMQQDPGYQFRLQEGMKALQSNAAAKGNIFSGGTMKALEKYGQDYASNEYGNVYGRAMNEYNTKLNASNTLYNRLAGLAGTGQTSATNLGQMGANTAAGVNSNLMNMANQVGQQYNNAAAARASGYIGSANAWSGAINNISQLPMMYGMMQQPQYGSTTAW